MSFVWSSGFALNYWMWRRSRRGAEVVGGLVLSHWLLDFVTHRPDLPLAPGVAKVGLGLWNSVAATVIIEGALFAAGVYLYATGTRARNRTGRIAFWALVLLLVSIYIANIVGPPPPSARAVGMAGLLTWLFVLWAVWIDRNREPAALEAPEDVAAPEPNEPAAPDPAGRTPSDSETVFLPADASAHEALCLDMVGGKFALTSPGALRHHDRGRRQQHQYQREIQRRSPSRLRRSSPRSCVLQWATWWRAECRPPQGSNLSPSCWPPV